MMPTPSVPGLLLTIGAVVTAFYVSMFSSAIRINVRVSDLQTKIRKAWLEYALFRWWMGETLIWLRGVRSYARIWVAEVRQQGRWTADYTRSLVECCRTIRPKLGSPEWREFVEHMKAEVTYEQNIWWNGKPPLKPEPYPYVPAWRLWLEGIKSATRESD